MKEFLGRIWMFSWYVAALAIAAFVLWYALRLHAHMWRQVAAHYRGKPSSTAIARKLEVALIAQRDMRSPNPLRNPRFRNYAGLMLTIHDEGLAFSLIPGFDLLCPPLFLPFGEMDLKRTDWALWRDPYAIRMRQLPGIDIIVDRETVRWIRDHVDRSPFGLAV